MLPIIIHIKGQIIFLSDVLTAKYLFAVVNLDVD